MPVTIKHSMNGLAAIKKIGISQTLFDWLHASNIEIKLTATKFNFIIPVSGSTQEFSVDVTLDQLQKLNAGMLASIDKLFLSQALTKAIQHLKNVYGSALELSVDKAPSVGGALGSLPPQSTSKIGKSKTFVDQGTAKWSNFDISKLKTAPLIKLRDADLMYQPVHGTSGGSRYYVVAGNDDIRVAARYTQGTLSVRIEGPKIVNHKAALISGGFEMKGGEYASVHLSVSTDHLAAKTLGAVLMGLGVPLDTTFPNLAVIKGV